MFKSENIVVKNGTIFCKLKHGSEMVSQLKYFTLIYKSFLYMYEESGITFIKFKEKKSFKNIFICILYHFDHAICCMTTVNSIKLT